MIKLSKKKQKKARYKPSIEEQQINDHTQFRVIEAYKTLRTNLLFSLSTANSRTTIISGAEPSSGKSTTSSNLAITIAQTGAKVILIDADMRNPTQHKLFSAPNSPGLSNILGGLCSTEDAIIDVMPNLRLIPAGEIPPNPSELLSSAHMASLLEDLEEQSDYILIDTPPICLITDSLTFIDRTAGMLLVARQNQTTYDMLQKAIDSIKYVNGNLLGLVINDASTEDSNYGYGSYGYGRYNKKLQ
ncbi:tyrosine protein kinase [Clostridia bacterium]|nr:tyrosine protein kinase [Clostridia bacterium]